MLAWAFAYSYLVCETWLPGSIISSISPGETCTFTELLSLSFSNLTATGLSDLLPITAPARVLIMLEQFTGVGYLAVVVSRLIGLTIKTGERKKSKLLEDKSSDHSSKV